MKRINIFGVRSTSHLQGRLAGHGIEVVIPEGMGFWKAVAYVEEELDLGLTDYVARPEGQVVIIPDQPVELWFHSTVAPKVRAMVLVSPETFADVLADFESSCLWEYDSVAAIPPVQPPRKRSNSRRRR